MKSIEIDRSKMLKDEPHTGHNRWHPDVEPKVEAEPGEEVVLETRDACDGQILFGDSVEAVSRIARGVVHPLTGPVYVKGAEPGDLLEIECLDVIPEAAGWTRISPGMGFLRDVFLSPTWCTGPSATAGPPRKCCPAFEFPTGPLWAPRALRLPTSRLRSGPVGRRL